MNTDYKLPQFKEAAITGNLRNTYTNVFNYKLINKEHSPLHSFSGVVSDWDIEEICTLTLTRTIVYTVTNRKRNITVNLALSPDGTISMDVISIAMLFDYIYASPQLPPRYSLVRNAFSSFINTESLDKTGHISMEYVTSAARKMRKALASEICFWINTDVKPVLESYATKNFFA